LIRTACQFAATGDSFPTTRSLPNSSRYLKADNTATNYTAVNDSVNGHLQGINTKLGTIPAALPAVGA